MSWESADKVQKNANGEFRAFIGGEWVPVAKAQKSASGEYRVERGLDLQGMQRDGLNRAAIRQQVETDPISQGAKAVSEEGVLPTWLAGKPSATLPERIASAPGTRFALGAAAPLIGAAQLMSNATGQQESPDNLFRNSSLRQLEEMKRAGGHEGIDLMGMAGNIASPVMIKGAQALGPATTAGARIAQGAAIGGAAGLTQPVTSPDYWTTKGEQATGGAVVGAAIPAAWEASKLLGRGVRNVAQPYLGQWGADQAAGRLANRTAGDRQAQVIAELRGSQPTVPGSNPTAGQASVGANSAEFAALQKMASERAPSEYFGPAGVEGQQNAARVAALRTVGQDKAAIDVAEKARGAAASPLYQVAGKEVIPTNLTPFQSLLSRPNMDKAIERAEALAAEQGRKFSLGKDVFGQLTPVSVDDMQLVKIAMDDLVKNPERFGIGASEQRAIQGTREAFIDWLSRASPNWDKARDTYAAMSKPINQMRVGQEVENRLVPALSEDAKQRAASYAQALRDAPGTIKRATGQPRYESLDQVMTPQQMQTFGNVQQDLANTATYEELARKGMPAAREAIGKSIPEAPPTGMFSPIISVLRGGYNRIAGKATDKTMDDLATIMRDPKRTAEIMENAKPFERKALVDALMKYQAAGAANAVSQGAQ